MARDITNSYMKHADKLEKLIHGIVTDGDLGDRALSVLASLSAAMVGITREYIEEFSDFEGMEDFIENQTDAMEGRLLENKERLKH